MKHMVQAGLAVLLLSACAVEKPIPGESAVDATLAHDVYTPAGVMAIQQYRQAHPDNSCTRLRLVDSRYIVRPEGKNPWDEIWMFQMCDGDIVPVHIQFTPDAVGSGTSYRVIAGKAISLKQPAPSAPSQPIVSPQPAPAAPTMAAPQGWH